MLGRHDLVPAGLYYSQLLHDDRSLGAARHILSLSEYTSLLQISTTRAEEWRQPALQAVDSLITRGTYSAVVCSRMDWLSLRVIGYGSTQSMLQSVKDEALMVEIVNCGLWWRSNVLYWEEIQVVAQREKEGNQKSWQKPTVLYLCQAFHLSEWSVEGAW